MTGSQQYPTYREGHCSMACGGLEEMAKLKVKEEGEEEENRGREGGREETEQQCVEEEAMQIDRGIEAEVFPDTMRAEEASGGGLRRYGWTYCQDLHEDENYMDLVLLLTRNSRCRGGHMACVLVKDGQILAMATNTSLFAPMASDVHAEINAIAACARRGMAVGGSDAYISMPPCKNCFMALQAAGVRRVVSRVRNDNERVAAAAAAQNIEMLLVPDTPLREQRRAALVHAHGGSQEEKERIERERKARKQAKQQLVACKKTRGSA
eukprot:764708-Hanusia_phi.AAC.3